MSGPLIWLSMAGLMKVISGYPFVVALRSLVFILFEFITWMIVVDKECFSNGLLTHIIVLFVICCV